MIFVVKSRKEIENGYFPGGYAVLISITDPDKNHCWYSDHYCDTLKIKFDDADIQHVPSIQLISTNDIKMILEFVNNNRETDFVVVNCEAGMSRSAGVAAALAKIFSGDDGYIIRVKPHYNRRVYGDILKYHYDKNPYTDFEKEYLCRFE